MQWDLKHTFPLPLPSSRAQIYHLLPLSSTGRQGMGNAVSPSLCHVVSAALSSSGGENPTVLLCSKMCPSHGRQSSMNFSQRRPWVPFMGAITLPAMNRSSVGLSQSHELLQEQSPAPAWGPPQNSSPLLNSRGCKVSACHITEDVWLLQHASLLPTSLTSLPA